MREEEAGQQIADAPACVCPFGRVSLSPPSPRVTSVFHRRALVQITSMADLDKDLIAQGLVTQTVR